ncbi:protein spinster homolog 3-like isoform X2 [Rhinopithecus roxellana]|uniref:protein spinster homolog 3-like isoform X2 n=1 Tax=Rhinopithecus roxellana TaxID=61622 RepID=UPI001237970E|nr:protein spinster homolog 3-like isoform X2 [Rhinopithecus roxellana]
MACHSSRQVLGRWGTGGKGALTWGAPCCAYVFQSVVVPRCRGTAEALQITVGHILGDAGSPYLTGLISSVLRARRPDSYLQRFLSLQQSFLCCAFVIALGGGCFLLTALYLERDEARAWQPGTG